MREQIWFAFKTLLTTLLMVMIMQTRLGSSTIEQHLLGFYYNSSLAVPVQQAVDGGVQAIRVGWQKALNFAKLKDKAGHSRWPMQFERHPKALEKQTHQQEEM